LALTKAAREALARELERAEGVPPLVERGVAFVRALRRRARPAQGQPADADFIDGLYRRP
jgi:antitoxin VapB